MRSRMKDRVWNSFSGRIILMILLGISLIAITVSTVVLAMSRNAFTVIYGRSQEQVFHQIENELNDFHTGLQTMVDGIDSSWAFRLYFGNDSTLDNVANFQNIYQMEMDLDRKKISGMDRMNVLIVGMNGKNYLSRTETITVSNADMMKSPAVLKAIANPESIQYTFSKGAYTATSQNANVIIASKALYYKESMEIYGIVLVTLAMDDMLEYYDYFVSEYTDWYFIDSDSVVMCSNQSARIGTEVDAKWYTDVSGAADGRYIWKKGGENLTILQKDMSYFGCSMYGVIDNEVALNELYNMPLLIFICLCVGIFILFCCLFFIQRTLKPLSNLVGKMSESRKGNFREYVPVEGTTEVKQLGITYNDMLDNIQTYISELLETQKAQRKSEIKALQLQINPHYIYNTLASIKWLVYQNNIDKTAGMIDAFISLLRNTISNMDEFITMEQELINLENYCLINYTRYGERIRVEYYVTPECYDCLLPKMVLQPFLENAFFHAFPSGQAGTIQIYANRKENNLVIQIVDDGIGMDKAQTQDALYQNKEHFSGIGIHNVQDRLQLLYGAEYGVKIESTRDLGTTVSVILPIKRAGDKEKSDEEME